MTIDGFEIYLIETVKSHKEGQPLWLADVDKRWFIARKDGVEIKANSLKYLKTKIKKLAKS